jgi:hypothetical protein
VEGGLAVMPAGGKESMMMPGVGMDAEGFLLGGTEEVEG